MHITISAPGVSLACLQNFKVPSKADSSHVKFNPVKSSKDMLSAFTEHVLGPQIRRVIHQPFVREREITIPIAPVPLRGLQYALAQPHRATSQG